MKLRALPPNGHGHTRGHKRSREYCSWASMIQRTTDRNSPDFKDYGARGITVCERWRSFVNFLEDMGPRPGGHSLDRIDNNRGYEKANCRWATARQQWEHRRPNPTRTACKRGHEFIGSNIMPLANGGRRCRACHHASTKGMAVAK